MSAPPILLLTHSGDFFTIDRVEAAVRARGARPLRIDTDRFPAGLRLTGRFRAGAFEAWLDTGRESIRLDEVRAIWSRRLWPGKMPPELDPRYAHHCRSEAQNAFFGLFSLLDRALWVNRIDRMRAAESKPLQLKIAGELGFDVPETLITNDPPAARSFYEHVSGRMITKLLGALSQTMDASGAFMYTSRVGPEHLEDLEGLRFAPQVFQPEIEKTREIRVIAVGRHLFAGAVDAHHSERASVDWRRATKADGLEWSREELPNSLRDLIHQLMDRLGLVYGALDFIVDSTNRYQFLEINPAGEWGWLERDLGFPIADAIAEVLVNGARA